ncbi:SdiA-regulated domain-containing protein [Pontiellaceae bacterium B1224]|nr:SdiA-regulated domain-containing protein [Pontiellaceae bacterium B1224]
MNIWFHTLLTCVSLLAFFVSPLFAQQTGSLPELYPYTTAVNIDESEFKEPSGICFHPVRQALFVVGDRGHVGELKPDGMMLRQKRIRKADFEGVTCNPATGLLYIAVEGDEVILEVDPTSFEILREFQIERSFNGELKMKEGGSGIEAITFVPDTNNIHGGYFYVANQGKDLANTTDVSAIFEVAVPLNGTKTKDVARIVRIITIDAIDLAGMHYDTSTGHLLVGSDKMDQLFAVALDGSVRSVYSLPGEDQEGVALDDDGALYIAQDSGGILKLTR